jgi:hypothetical protein
MPAEMRVGAVERCWWLANRIKKGFISLYRIKYQISTTTFIIIYFFVRFIIDRQLIKSIGLQGKGTQDSASESSYANKLADTAH